MIHASALLTALVLTAIATNAPAVFCREPITEYMDRVSEIIVKLEELSRVGMNTSSVENYLNSALRLLSKSELSDIEKNWVENNLTLAEKELEKLWASKSSFQLWKNMHLTITIALLLTIPLATYFFLPKAWAYVWFKTRRKWIVKKRK